MGKNVLDTAQSNACLVSWDDFNFRLHETFRPGFDEISRGIVWSLVQFDFSYCWAIITVNSTFIVGLSASKSNTIKTICDLQAEM